MPAGSPQPANPIVKVTVAVAGTLAAMAAKQLLEKGWGPCSRAAPERR